tara:strand:- start:53 stop:310 length:258 start_codon:yes stop_codon:yes gene_type:complete
MAFTKMTTAELELLGLESQKYPGLDRETGVLKNRFWDFEDVFITTDLLEFRRKYISNTDAVYLISFKNVLETGTAYTKYEFYKET